ncbi:sugar O-acetyltransferase [Oceanotoga sp. DSM 15011]|uniref:sugar O-acetyltransferase n=1 Tax=Oceanotoga sp. DSM 15011 TaxID=2984951 RepID=UPI0021F4C4E9|nr:sugar O-acetyltransferase [Oceanotoga sp. DSM 15011]
MNKELENMIQGKLYRSGDPFLIQARRNARLLFEEYNKTSIDEFQKRKEILKKLLGKTGENFYIEPDFKVDYGFNIFIGENFYMNYDCVILDCSTVKIGDNVMFGPGVHIYTAYHPLEFKKRNSGYELAAPIEIGDNVWIGGGAIINPGIKIGNNSVIGSGSVVTKDIPDNVFVAGNPCKIIKDIKNDV